MNGLSTAGRCRFSATRPAEDAPMTTTTATPTSNPADGTVVDRFLAEIAGGTGISAGLFATDATVDATVPGWRFTIRGAAAIAAQYGHWFNDRAVFESVDRWPIPGGEVVRYDLAWTENGVPHACHHCHLLTLGVDGLITADTVFCGGRWDASLLARMEEANR